jgi:hypothetical protein
MAKRPTKRKKRLPVRYPSVPDTESGRTKYDEPDLPRPPDRVPERRFELGSTPADLRLRIERLLQSKEGVPESAWDALGPEAHTFLVAMLNDEVVRSEESLLQRTISAVGQLSLASGIASLGAILVDKAAQPVTRAYAANALGRIGDAAALDSLMTAARSTDDMIRRQVAIALGRIDDAAVVPHLIALDNDSSVAVKEVAGKAVRRWEDRLGQKLVKRQRRDAPPTARPGRKKAPAADRS